MADVVLRRPRVPDGEPQHVAAAEFRVREEHLARAVDPLEQRLVLLVGSVPPEADEREVPRRDRPPSPARPDPGLEQLRRAARARGSVPGCPSARSSGSPPRA